ncbi:GDP-D-glucose phosphorylase 1 [Araneus ventricosus]|uniref:GDP-D-glucose phosphorylase 1 n=1 Tax=Araneus ventricosus TaxID=182803 RepID=A0A4Y2DVU4_ARAVE|nr:GDP-D-glucose phosphorylase 1 [Araneus ventricosus]
MIESSIQFSYSEDDFIFETSPDKNSLFDQYLKTNWETKMQNGCFRYQLGDLQTKDLQGKYNFIVQLNIKRAIERRTPQLVSDIIMPFDKDKFHFGKVNEKEVLFMIQPQHWFESKPESNKEIYKHALIINVSPLEFGHSLLIPCIDKFCPQVLNFDAIRLAVEMMLISSDSYFRLGFNSLGAYASVNHLHFHAYYLKYRLYLESAPVVQLEDRCYIVTSFPSEGFAFEVIKKEDILEVIRSAMILIEFLVEKRIPHNIFLTRGSRFSPSEKENSGIPSVRLYVWAREAYYGTKNDLSFNVAVCELAGHIPIKDKRSFENIDEANIAAKLKEACHSTFVSIKDKVKKLYK